MKIEAEQFKARCLKLMDAACQTRQEIIITKHGKPVAKLVPLMEAPPGRKVVRFHGRHGCDLPGHRGAVGGGLGWRALIRRLLDYAAGGYIRAMPA